MSTAGLFAYAIALSVAVATPGPAIFAVIFDRGRARSMPQTYARTPSQVASLQRLIMQMSNLGLLAGPPLIAAVVTSSGQWESSLVVMLAAAGAVLVCGQVVNRHERRFAVAAPAP